MKISTPAILFVASAIVAVVSGGDDVATPAEDHGVLRRAKKGGGQKGKKGPKQPKTPKVKKQKSNRVDMGTGFPGDAEGRVNPGTSIAKGQTAKPESAAAIANRVGGCSSGNNNPGQMKKMFYAVPQVKGPKIVVEQKDFCFSDCDCGPCYCCFKRFSSQSVCMKGLSGCPDDDNTPPWKGRTDAGYCCDMTSDPKGAKELGPYTVAACPDSEVSVTIAIQNGCTEFTLARFGGGGRPIPVGGATNIIGGDGGTR